MQTSESLTNGGRAPAAATLSRSDVEDFLFHEATLLDEWRLEEWLGLFDEAAHFLVPSTDRPNSDPRTAQFLVSDRPNSDPRTAQFLVSDDYGRIRARVKRLKSKHAHAENPHSRTRRLITNVQVQPGEAAGHLDVSASFLIYRIRDGNVDPYVGRYAHDLVVTPDGPRFWTRRAMLDFERLQPGGRISFIV